VNPPAEDGELVAPPTSPTGPPFVLRDSLAEYTTGGAESSLGHDVEYQFVWGEGRLSQWAAEPRETTTWEATGSYEVKARARCKEHSAEVSDWSTAISVQVGVETVSPPAAPAGVPVLCTGSVAGYRSGGATSSVGHPVEYQFDWGDGLSYWLPQDSVRHAWALPGVYDCRARARCALDTTVVSAGSASLPVAIESRREPWIIEADLPELVGPDLGSRIVRIPYDGPRARVTRLKLDLAGRAAGTTCQTDWDPEVYTLWLILWPAVGIEGGESIWAPLGMFFGLPPTDFLVENYWVSEGSAWTSPKILEPGDRITVCLYTQVDDYIGSCGRGSAFCNITMARLTLELDCEETQ
jgi:hypothetical protein